MDDKELLELRTQQLAACTKCMREVATRLAELYEDYFDDRHISPKEILDLSDKLAEVRAKGGQS